MTERLAGMIRDEQVVFGSLRKKQWGTRMPRIMRPVQWSRAVDIRNFCTTLYL